MRPLAKDGDPLLKDTVWKGKLTQKGEYKGAVLPEFDCEFTVTSDGDKFEAELFEKTDDLKLDDDRLVGRSAWWTRTSRRRVTRLGSS